MLPRGGNPVNTSHVRPECRGDDDAAVRLLVVLQDGDKGPSHRQPRTVQGVDKFHLAALFTAETDRRPTRLKFLKIAAGGDLPIGILPGQPGLDDRRSWQKRSLGPPYRG